MDLQRRSLNEDRQLPQQMLYYNQSEIRKNTEIRIQGFHRASNRSATEQVVDFHLYTFSGLIRCYSKPAPEARHEPCK